MTKSGTKDFHGNLYEFIRNEAFNARNYFDQPGRVPLYRRHDFGGTIGGPLFIPHVFNTRRTRRFSSLKKYGWRKHRPITTRRCPHSKSADWS